uniref:Uncharacterized protein n=1 Tax=Setaria viridis TaxID=4556 RepID=A0A4U6TR09_SETVI|nr:hypothetical protein SEVIR_7G067990v2 [Setaria viridis]
MAPSGLRPKLLGLFVISILQLQYQFSIVM